MNSFLFAILVGVIVLSSYFEIGNGSIITYKNHALIPGHPEYLVFPKFAKNDAPNWWPGNGNSFIDLSRINAKVDCTVAKGILPTSTNYNCKDSAILDVLVFESLGNQPWIDYWDDHQYCCNQDQISAG